MTRSENVDVMYFHGTTCDGYRFTIAGVVDNDDLLLGAAICSDGDTFCKSKGRIISSGRVLNQRHNPKGRHLISLYSSSLNIPYKSDVGYTENYFKGIEIKVFREIVKHYNFFTKKELQTEFSLLHR